MPIFWMLAAAMILRTDPPSLTPAQATAMPPAQLGDAVLAAGHPKIVEARIGIQGFVPMPQRGAPMQTPIMLLAAAHASRKSGFCEQDIAHILLAPVINAGSETAAAAPVAIHTETTYRWIADRDHRTACVNPEDPYFSVTMENRQRAFTLIRSLADLQTGLGSGRKSGFQVTINDRLAVQLRDFASTNPDPRTRPTIEQTTPIVDPETALRSVPLDSIRSIIFDQRSWNDPDPTGTDKRKRTIVSLFAGGEWAVDIAFAGAAIKAIAIVREIPPPS